MSEILFKCQGCSMSLCVCETAAGSVLACPSCQANITLPEPDFSFSCPSCGVTHLAPTNMAHQQFVCPSCGNTFTIPATGVKHLKPLKAKPRTITCNSCATVLEVEDRVFIEMAGQSVECPMCRGSITLPMPLSKKALFTPPPLAPSLPPPPAQPPLQPPTPALAPPPRPETANCPSCRKEMPLSAVICIKCGFDLRTGRKLVQETCLNVDLPEEESSGGSRLRFKNGKPEDPALHSALQRHAFSPFLTWQNMILWGKFKSTARTVATLLLTLSAVLGTLYFANLGKSETASWKKATQALNTLKNSPADTNALEIIRSVIPTVESSLTGSTPKSGLMAVWALGQLEAGKIDHGMNACKWIEQKFSGSRFAGDIAPNTYSNTCNACKGETLKCPKCQGSPVKCYACNGLGRIITQKQARVHRLGDDKPSIRCIACNGTGNGTPCGLCRNTGRDPNKCEQCRGAGWQLAKERVSTTYRTVLGKEFWYASAKLAFEKVLDAGIWMQELLHFRKPGTNHTVQDDIPALVAARNDDEFLPGGSPAHASRDWETRYQELLKFCTEKFTPPRLNQHIAVQLEGGNVQEGTLISLTETNLQIRPLNVNATITLWNNQLDMTSRLRCFCNDFSTFYASKKLDAEKREAAGILQ